MKKSTLIIASASMAVGVFFLASASFAAGPDGYGSGGMMGHGKNMMRMPGVFGTVSSISGDTLTVTQMKPNQVPSGTGASMTFTVDATNATVTKNGAVSSLSDIATGDHVFVEGSVSGTSVTATKILDGVMMGGRGRYGSNASGTRPFGSRNNQTPPIQGNGEPVTAGTVTAVNGNTVTITNKSNVTYTIDDTNATVVKNNATSSISALAVGDNIVVQGAVNGNSVTASSIIDQGMRPNPQNGNANGPAPRGNAFGRIFGGLGGFFHRVFGFF